MFPVLSWPVWLNWSGIAPQSKTSLVQFLIEARAWVVGLDPSQSACGKQLINISLTSMFLSLSSPPYKKKRERKKEKKSSLFFSVREAVLFLFCFFSSLTYLKENNSLKLLRSLLLSLGPILHASLFSISQIKYRCVCVCVCVTHIVIDSLTLVCPSTDKVFLIQQKWLGGHFLP